MNGYGAYSIYNFPQEAFVPLARDASFVVELTS
jgi:hypothetical protein